MLSKTVAVVEPSGNDGAYGFVIGITYNNGENYADLMPIREIKEIRYAVRGDWA